MKLSVLALDYDGTIARGDALDPSVREAIAAARAARDCRDTRDRADPRRTAAGGWRPAFRRWRGRRKRRRDPFPDSGGHPRSRRRCRTRFVDELRRRAIPVAGGPVPGRRGRERCAAAARGHSGAGTAAGADLQSRPRDDRVAGRQQGDRPPGRCSRRCGCRPAIPSQSATPRTTTSCCGWRKWVSPSSGGSAALRAAADCRARRRGPAPPWPTTSDASPSDWQAARPGARPAPTAPRASRGRT